MACAKSKYKPHHISRVQTYPNLKWMGGFDQGWLGPGQGIGGAGATPGRRKYTCYDRSSGLRFKWRSWRAYKHKRNRPVHVWRRICRRWRRRRWRRRSPRHDQPNEAIGPVRMIRYPPLSPNRRPNCESDHCFVFVFFGFAAGAGGVSATGSGSGGGGL